jgi:hypothetical protein
MQALRICGTWRTRRRVELGGTAPGTVQRGLRLGVREKGLIAADLVAPDDGLAGG